MSDTIDARRAHKKQYVNNLAIEVKILIADKQQLLVQVATLTANLYEQSIN